jgi:hypothetical protein
MPPVEAPVEDSVPKVTGQSGESSDASSSNQLAVGEDLDFQRRWWRFESIIWTFFLLILIADVLGLFGRGWLAKAKRTTPDHALTLDYERIERASTPSIMTLHFGPASIHNGKIQLYISDSLVKPLGAQRISPQPETSAVGNGGITYTFAATQAPAIVQIALEPSFPGSHPFRIQLSNEPPFNANIFVVP